MCLLLKSSLLPQYFAGLVFQIANIVDIPLVVRMRELSRARVSFLDFESKSSNATALAVATELYITILARDRGDKANIIKNNIHGIYFKFIVSSLSKNLRGL